MTSCSAPFTREAATGIAGVIRIGMYTPVIGGPHMLQIIKTFESRHTGARAQLIDTGLARPQLDWLRRHDVDLLAMRLPLNDVEIVIGPILSHEKRIVAVACDHPLASQESVCLEDLADYPISDVGTLEREMMEAFIPPRTPAGTPLRRVEISGPSQAIMRVATGECVHPTVPSFFEYHQHPSVTAIPIRDLPPSQDRARLAKDKPDGKGQGIRTRHRRARARQRGGRPSTRASEADGSEREPPGQSTFTPGLSRQLGNNP